MGEKLVTDRSGTDFRVKPSAKRWASRLFIAALFSTNTVQAAVVKVSIVDQKGDSLPGAVVTFNPIDIEMDPLQNTTAFIDQINKEFVPEVTVVQVGTSINFPNNDDILHHVYSFSEAKTFDLPLYEGTPAEPVIFNVPGLVTLGCNIHDWMRAYVVVVDTPYYQTSNGDGVVVIRELPVGDYQLEIWHPRQRRSHIENVYVGIKFNLDIEIATKPQLKSRRHAYQGGGYNQ